MILGCAAAPVKLSPNPGQHLLVIDVADSPTIDPKDQLLAILNTQRVHIDSGKASLVRM